MNMKYIIIIIGFLVVVIVLGYLGFLGRESVPQESTVPTQVNLPINTDSAKLETQTDDQNSIVVKVTPLAFGKNLDTWKFKVVFDTHSESLDGDLLTTTILTDSEGKVSKPTVWEGSPAGSHHREGIISFDGSNVNPDKVTMQIRLSEDDVRSFVLTLP